MKRSEINKALKELEDMCRDAWRFQQTLMEADRSGR